MRTKVETSAWTRWWSQPTKQTRLQNWPWQPNFIHIGRTIRTLLCVHVLNFSSLCFLFLQNLWKKGRLTPTTEFGFEYKIKMNKLTTYIAYASLKFHVLFCDALAVQCLFKKQNLIQSSQVHGRECNTIKWNWVTFNGKTVSRESAKLDKTRPASKSTWENYQSVKLKSNWRFILVVVCMWHYYITFCFAYTHISIKVYSMHSIVLTVELSIFILAQSFCCNL